MAVTTWNIVPDYDNWGWDDYWKAKDWQDWYVALEQHFGAAQAKYVWEYAWRKQTMGANPIGARMTNMEFRRFAEKNNLNLYTGELLETIIAEPAGKIIEAGSDLISGFTSGLSTTGKTLKFIIPAAVILGVAYLGTIIYSKVKKA